MTHTKAAHAAGKFHVFTHLSGCPSLRGTFDSFEEAKALQSELHRQGWYFVPVYSTERAREERYDYYPPAEARTNG